MIQVPADVRSCVVRYAREITTRAADPSAVLANASPLLAWLEDATGMRDQAVRRDALQHQWCALLATAQKDRAPWQDNPTAFLADAQVIYGFTSAAGGKR